MTFFFLGTVYYIFFLPLRYWLTVFFSRKSHLYLLNANQFILRKFVMKVLKRVASSLFMLLGSFYRNSMCFVHWSRATCNRLSAVLNPSSNVRVPAFCISIHAVLNAKSIMCWNTIQLFQILSHRSSCWLQIFFFLSIYAWLLNPRGFPEIPKEFPINFSDWSHYFIRLTDAVSLHSFD